MIKFELNKKYYGVFVTNSDSKVIIEVTKRTDKTLWFKLNDKIIRKKIETYDNYETIYPLGKYSMALIITAKKEIE